MGIHLYREAFEIYGDWPNMAKAFNICGGRQKLLIYVEAKAENTSGPYNDSPNGGGRRRRPPPFGEGRLKAAPHYMVR